MDYLKFGSIWCDVRRNGGTFPDVVAKSGMSREECSKMVNKLEKDGYVLPKLHARKLFPVKTLPPRTDYVVRKI